MVGITIKIFIRGEASGKPQAVDIFNVPKMFGVCVYSFMCHHSVPSILTPIRHKRHMLKGLMLDYGIVFVLYIFISFTGIFAFENVMDVYTLNFQMNE